ncbi:hypothetical protein BJX65DRAFT_280040 [Aspergillus insuetus]
MASRLGNAAYTVGWVCVDHINLATARAMLEEEHGSPQEQAHLDDNSYILGRIRLYNIAIACVPAGERGIVSASVTASEMILSFPEIRFGVLVGTGGGIPSNNHDIQLGDVAVSIPDQIFGGVVQFDLGKATLTGFV